MGEAGCCLEDASALAEAAQAVLDSLSSAWGSAASYAALFSSSAECTVRGGIKLKGAQILKAFEYAFSSTHAGTRLEDCRVQTAAACADGSVLVTASRTVVRISSGERTEYATSLQLVRDEQRGVWLISRFASKRLQQQQQQQQAEEEQELGQEETGSQLSTHFLLLGACVAVCIVGLWAWRGRQLPRRIL
jgi:uncharacterized protein (TIGR02246 family)